MPFHFHLGENVPDIPLGINDECGAHNPHRPLPVKVLFLPHTIALQHGVRSITRQRKIQFVLVAELLQLSYGISTDTENSCPELVQFFFGITELVRLASSTGGVRFTEKEEDDNLALESVQRNLIPGVGR